ncbi:MAG: Gfo/Idh/MocA family oxidoreductase, partial [Planctomycetes bacterium]|nr:Gfo/Idh/MocA family oxidoreductase [Planctomycetota bacterium]
GAAALSAGVWSGVSARASNAANEKLNIACIGTANRAAVNIQGVKGENIVAICDIDSNYLSRASEQFPNAKTYVDYREMLDSLAGKIDAVVIGTADHHHAPATIRAIRAGLHVYCEKPMTHTVHEARVITEAAKKHGVATQLGTQIHADDNYRRVVEIIQSGAIGEISEVHVWVGKGWGAREDLNRPTESEAPPASLDWDLWLGPAPVRPFAKGHYHPAQWRRWWDFGQGTLGDMGSHYMDLPFWALGLRHPTRCEAEGPEVHPEGCPPGLIVRYDFPATDAHAAIQLTWYDGNKAPKTVAGERVKGSGVMFVGSEGKMFADYGSYRLFPTEKFADFEPPAPTIAKSIGHHAEWIKACKEGTPATCNFDYAGPLTETVLLGNVAYRTGEAIDWDAANLKVTNTDAAEKYIRKEYRSGWEVA